MEDTLHIKPDSKILSLSVENRKNITMIKKVDGSNYSVRQDRKRYFFPHEWLAFEKLLRLPKQRLFFLTALHTGARAMEILHLQPSSFDFERGTITFSVVKHRTAKKNFYATGRSRTFFVSKDYLKEVKKYLVKNKLEGNTYIFLDNNKLPSNYSELSNNEKKKYYEGVKSSYAITLKNKLKKVGIIDYYNFSLHNIRKTYGNWMRIFDIKIEELCYRLGHDVDTYLLHYGSSLIFTSPERLEIMRIMGDVR